MKGDKGKSIHPVVIDNRQLLIIQQQPDPIMNAGWERNNQ